MFRFKLWSEIVSLTRIRGGRGEVERKVSDRVDGFVGGGGERGRHGEIMEGDDGGTRGDKNISSMLY